MHGFKMSLEHKQSIEGYESAISDEKKPLFSYILKKKISAEIMFLIFLHGNSVTWLIQKGRNAKLYSSLGKR